MQLSGEAPDFPVCPCHLGDGAREEAACGLFVSMGHCSQLTPIRSILPWLVSSFLLAQQQGQPIRLGSEQLLQ